MGSQKVRVSFCEQFGEQLKDVPKLNKPPTNRPIDPKPSKISRGKKRLAMIFEQNNLNGCRTMLRVIVADQR
jgi:hypothetical protein